jgi:hypothetical protein
MSTYYKIPVTAFNALSLPEKAALVACSTSREIGHNRVAKYATVAFYIIECSRESECTCKMQDYQGYSKSEILDILKSEDPIEGL